ncbi:MULTISPECIES: UvrD-helicase domain-containing protein [unclassified Sphingomonas]|uniref:UvrD-helicase domain-containing protein n=1 Tax=unclassified Sphingomonas TaxID=196159 RepID=UPI0006FBA951|nr:MULTISPECIES: UvrD-helicase domain-containing protein [unclassified Sphingomonas]KQM27916.1 DNA helicase II [Sphingomonas sp. Leaf9]KQM44255.1 DNA helicase II [Sphingomonas sp. Leaf11]KQN73509.1 DNA helicase II [Sphingomonas sp. Leaf62]
MADGESPADAAGRAALEQVFACFDEGRSFRLEAGAGAGKTYSLEKALRRLLALRGSELMRNRQQIGCITFTNVAKDEIASRVQAHPAVRPETIHGFCWSLLQDFQPEIRALVPTLEGWADRLAEADVAEIGVRTIQYEFGYPRVTEAELTLRHEDVLTLMTALLARPKFRAVMTARFPVLLIDEYQDTDAGFVNALKQHFLDTGTGPVVGLFGDHWQKIYGDGCGAVEHAALQVIDKNANFRSVEPIVSVLNRMRPALPQIPSDADAPGEARLFHTNAWPGQRRTGQGGGHWTGDTSAEAARAYFDHLKGRLIGEGWDFAVERTKILMLSHSVLAREQGYPTIQQIYGQFNDPWLKKEDPHIKFLADQVEPACAAFQAQRYGEMFGCLDAGHPSIRRHKDKAAWSQSFQELIELRHSGTIGQVIDFMRAQEHMRVPEAVIDRENRLAAVGDVPTENEPRRVTQLRRLRDVSYAELMAVDAFIDGHTPFATKHGVKGAEFENVLVIVGRGWNKYNFGQMLEWLDQGPPGDKTASFESNRNLFYVACSRPKRRLALLFTQVLSQAALAKVLDLFGTENVIALPADPSVA